VTPELAATEGAATALAALVAAYDEDPGVDTAGALLWAVVAALRAHDVDAETALRARAREFRDRVATVERDAHAEGVDVRELAHGQWRERWDTTQP
jgi:XTP/dITP diphosphohydrolase